MGEAAGGTAALVTTCTISFSGFSSGGGAASVPFSVAL
jgi:hypothetical protein